MNEQIEQQIKSELSKIIPDDGIGYFLRVLIFGNTWDWFDVANMIKSHFPEKRDNIQRILDNNLSDNERKIK